MKFTLSWLKDHLDTDITLDNLLIELVNLGLEVESVENKTDREDEHHRFGAYRPGAEHPVKDRGTLDDPVKGDEDDNGQYNGVVEKEFIHHKSASFLITSTSLTTCPGLLA